MSKETELRAKPRRVSRLEELPTEILLMILQLLKPNDVKSLHSTSRLLNAVSESRYARFFFEKTVVFIEPHSLYRFDAISRDDISRRRVRQVVISPWKMRAKTPRYGAMGPPLEGSKEQQWALLSFRAATMICGAIGRLQNCKSLAVDASVDLRWYTDESTASGWAIFGFFGPKNPLLNPPSNTYPKKFTSDILQIALAAMNLCHQVENFSVTEYQVGENGCISTDMLPPLSTNLDWCRPLEHVKHFGVCFGGIEWEDDEDQSTNNLLAFLACFPALESLALRFGEPTHVLSLCQIMDTLSDRIDEITLENLKLDEGDIGRLVDNERFARLQRLTLSSCDIQGGYGAWKRVIQLMCDRLNLRSLRFRNCLSGAQWLCNLSLGSCDPRYRKSGYSYGDVVVMEYLNVNASTKEEVLKTFKKDTMGKPVRNESFIRGMRITN